MSVGRGLDKTILSGITLQFRPAELVALMGPSGAGKTTLLSCILDNAAGKMSGEVLINGQAVPQHLFKSVSKLIPQEDVLMHALTVRETLGYQSELVLPGHLERAEREARVAHVVKALNLGGCLDVKIGSVESRGISGGQRKRVSIAMDLLSNPAVLFVDEPTSGLDSKTAEDVVQALRDLARGRGDGVERTIISTIHQPSWRIFALFDQVVLLTRGRLAFHGAHAELERFFDRLGLASPAKENPADHYMRMMQDDAEADRICDEFARLQRAAGAEHDDGDGARLDTAAIMRSYANRQQRLSEMPRYPTSLRQQFATLFRRSTYEAIKDPAKVCRNLALKLIVGLLVGFVWWRAADPPILQHVFPIEGAMFSIVLNR